MGVRAGWISSTMQKLCWVTLGHVFVLLSPLILVCSVPFVVLVNARCFPRRRLRQRRRWRQWLCRRRRWRRRCLLTEIYVLHIIHNLVTSLRLPLWPGSQPVSPSTHQPNTSPDQTLRLSSDSQPSLARHCLLAKLICILLRPFDESCRTASAQHNGCYLSWTCEKANKNRLQRSLIFVSGCGTVQRWTLHSQQKLQLQLTVLASSDANLWYKYEWSIGLLCLI